MFEFTEIKFCPKCGEVLSDFLGVKVSELGQEDSYSEKRPRARIEFMRSSNGGEWLEVSCMCCGFSWNEKTKDAE